MRLPVIAVLAFALLAAPAAADASGGAVAPSDTGGAEYGIPYKAPRALRPVAPLFHVTARATVGDSIHFAYRIRSKSKTVRVRVAILRVGESRPAYNVDLGEQRTGVRIVSRWSTASAAAGNYLVRLHVVDPDGRRLARSSRASGRANLALASPPAPDPTTPSLPSFPTLPASGGPGVFPLQGGDWSFGGKDAVFGAGRTGHTHQGQDITAPTGTPIVAPRAGTVTWRKYQAHGAGYYLVIRDDTLPRDYVFDHIHKDTELVSKGDHVAAGQPIAQVGTSGDASGPHLHFEIWVGGWYEKGGAPIDPLPDLKRWAGR